MPLFLVAFFAVYGGVHAYALLKAKSALGFGWGTTLVLSPLFVLLAGAPVAVHHLGRHGMESAARAATWIGYVWMGLLFFFFWTNLALDALNLLSRATGTLSGRWAGPLVPGRGGFVALVSLSIALAAYAFIEARQIRVERISVTTGKLPAGTPRLRVAQISDVHLGLIVRQARAASVARVLREAEPDLVVSTGDLVDGEINHLEGLAEILEAVRPPLGKYAVTGNHEYYAGIDQAVAFTERAGFTVLRGAAAMPGNVLRLVGVEDPAGRAFGAGTGRREAALLREGETKAFTILLKHRPVVHAASAGLFDIQLSGHTHDGQIFPFRYVVRLATRAVAGLADAGGGSRLYTNRGTGTWGPPMRFLAPPEVTIVDIAGASPPSPPPGAGGN